MNADTTLPSKDLNSMDGIKRYLSQQETERQALAAAITPQLRDGIADTVSILKQIREDIANAGDNAMTGKRPETENKSIAELSREMEGYYDQKSYKFSTYAYNNTGDPAFPNGKSNRSEVSSNLKALFISDYNRGSGQVPLGMLVPERLEALNATLDKITQDKEPLTQHEEQILRNGNAYLAQAQALLDKAGNFKPLRRKPNQKDSPDDFTRETISEARSVAMALKETIHPEMAKVIKDAVSFQKEYKDRHDMAHHAAKTQQEPDNYLEHYRGSRVIGNYAEYMKRTGRGTFRADKDDGERSR